MYILGGKIMTLLIDLGFLTTINYIFYLILGLAILAGFLRGFKKTVYAFIIMAIFYVIFFVTINQAVQFLWTFEMPWLGDMLGSIDPALSDFTSFESSMDSIIGLLLGSEIQLDSSSAEVLALATGLVQFALKLVWTLVYFTAVLLIWKLLTWIIGAIFIKNKKMESKNRGFGALFGALNGLMAVFVMMIMLGGFMSVFQSALQLMSSTEPEPLAFEIRESSFDGSQSVIPLAENEDLDTIINEMQAMVDEYNNNLLVNLASKITTPSSINEAVEVPLHIDLFDRILSFEYNGNVVGLRYELAVFSNAASVLLDSDYMETKVLSDITGDEIREIFADLSQSTLLTSLMPVAIEVAADMYDTELPITLEELYAIDFEEELATLGSIAGALFDVLNGAGFIGGEGSLDQIEIDGDAIRDLFADIAGSDTILLITESLLLPMLSETEGDISAILTVPDDLVIEDEYLALGDIFAEIIEADISFADLENASISVLLEAASQVDLTVLLNSKLVTEALINILSGAAGIEGLDIFVIPDGIVWRDVYDGFGNLVQAGELRSILEAVNVLTQLSTDIDLENISMSALMELDDADIDTLLSSYVIRATISDILEVADIGSMLLVVPDGAYDELGYFTQDELANALKSMKLLLNDTGDGFDVTKAFNLTSEQIDTLLASQIIYATIGNKLYDLGLSTLVIPDDIVTTVTAGDDEVSVIIASEIKKIFNALAILNITNIDSLNFDASIIGYLENDTLDGLDDAKITILLDSAIIKATVSDMIINLDESSGGQLVIPVYDQNGVVVRLYDAPNDLYLISNNEITSLLKALYGLDIDSFDTINMEDTSTILSKMDLLLDSAIIHATVSKTVLDLEGTIIIPVQDIEGNDIIIEQGSVTYIDSVELNSFFTALDMLDFDNPDNVNTDFDLSVLEDEDNQDILLESAIMHATVSDRVMNLGVGSLIVPAYAENGTTEIRKLVGPIAEETEFIIKSELKILFDAINVMGFTNLGNVASGVSSATLLDNDTLIYDSSILQATISNQILTSTSDNLLVPDEDETLTDIRIVLADVTYIRNSELQDFITSIKLLGITDFNTFNISADDIFTIDLNTFFSSYIMQATVSKYILDNADDETAPAGTNKLLVPNEKREEIDVDSIATEQIEKQELIYIIQALDTLGMTNFTDSMDATAITGLTPVELDSIFDSASFHVTVDNMLKSNTFINTSIPNLAQTDLYGVSDLTTRLEVVAFITAVNTLGATNFEAYNVNIAAIALLDTEQRETVLDSMIIRTKITPDLEALADLDPGFDFEPEDYEIGSVPQFLTKTAALDAMELYYPA